MENIFLIDVDVNHIIAVAEIRRHIILDGINSVVDIDLLAIDIPGESPDTIVSDYDVCVK